MYEFTGLPYRHHVIVKSVHCIHLRIYLQICWSRILQRDYHIINLTGDFPSGTVTDCVSNIGLSNLGISWKSPCLVVILAHHIDVILTHN